MAVISNRFSTNSTFLPSTARDTVIYVYVTVIPLLAVSLIHHIVSLRQFYIQCLRMSNFVESCAVLAKVTSQVLS